MPKIISANAKRGWLAEYEGGKSEAAIAEASHRDTRTVKKGIEDARRERDARLVRVELLKEAARGHQDALKQGLGHIAEDFRLPRVDLAPLSWQRDDVSIFTSLEKLRELGYVAVGDARTGKLAATNSSSLDILKQHLKNDPLWGLLDQREEALRSHIAHRIAIQRRLVSLLEQETGYRLDDKGEDPLPFLCSYTCGPLLYGATLSFALGSRPRARLEDEIVADPQTGTVRTHGSILAAARGDEERCRRSILSAYRKLLRSRLITQLKDSHEELEKRALKAKLAAEEIKAVGFIAGQCHICKRLGL